MTDAIEAGARAVIDVWERHFTPLLRDREANAIAKACIEAAIASGALVPASAVAEMRERCAAAARQVAINAERRAADHTNIEAKQSALDKAEGAFAAEDRIRQLDLAPSPAVDKPS